MNKSKLCRYSILGCRIFLGLIFFVFGLNGFLQFLPMPPLAPEAMQFIMTMAGTGYLMVLVKAIEVACGALLLSGLCVPFALVLLGPVVVNIFLFHLFLDRGGMVMTLIIMGLWLTLLYCYRSYYRSVFACKTSPESC